MTGTGSYENMQKLGKNREITLGELVFGGFWLALCLCRLCAFSSAQNSRSARSVFSTVCVNLSVGGVFVWNFEIFQYFYFYSAVTNQFAWFYVKLLWRMFKVSKKNSSNDSILSLTSLIWQIFWKENTISKRFGWCPSKSSAHCRTLHFNVPYRLIWKWTTTARVRHVFIFLESENIEKEWWKSCLWKFIIQRQYQKYRLIIMRLS